MSGFVFHVVHGEEELNSKQRALLKRLRSRYTAHIIRTVLVPLINKQAPVSLRALDWAVVNWSKQVNAICTSLTPGRYTNIHKSYQESLRFWKRRLFDPFRRRYPLEVRIDGQVYRTTLGQANFALFVFETGIMAYVVRNIADIEENMNHVVHQQREERSRALKDGRKRSRSELTKSTSPPCMVYRATVQVRL